MSEFVHLHNHTHFSLLDGACKIDEMLELCEQFKMSSLAITDHGAMFGAIEFYTKALEKGIKPIIGAEVYIAPESRFLKTSSKDDKRDTSYHLVLLAKDFTGYRNLMKLTSIGFTEGFYYKPRIDKEVLMEHRDGLVALSACLKGEVSRMILKEGMEKAVETAGLYKEMFGDDYYLEIQNHGIPEENTVLNAMREVSAKTGVPLVATNDIHYLKKEHAEAHDVLVCLQTGKDYDDPNRMRLQTDQLYFKSGEEMARLFSEIPEAIENSLVIADKCNLELNLKDLHLPDFTVPEKFGDISLDEYLKILTLEGLPRKYPIVTPELRERLNFELDVISEMKYAGYFLIVKDFIDYARSQGIAVGPGRGSAAGSLVSYALGITNIDPTKYGLFFERFLNPERVSMPDIDIDFCYERREEIIKYVKEKYGEDNVTQIITFGTMAARAVIRDVGRVLKMPYGDVDKIAKMIPALPGMTIEKAMEKVSELREIPEKDETHKKLMDYSRVLEGIARHASTHAAGVIITPEELTNFTPLYKSSQGDTTSAYDMSSLETTGVLKMDFLGLRTLTVIQKALEMLKERGVEINIDQISLEDKATYEIFANGETIGVFQFESSGMREYLKKLKPVAIEDLVAMNALYRPGPMKYIDDFIKRRFGQEKIEYTHEILKPILEETYGVIVYQEQVMEIAREMAGYSLGKADVLRRAMGKKKKKLMLEQKKEFMSGARAAEIDKKTAEDVFDLMEKFAEYGFNKSHAVSYSLVAYQTAYLKAHYPVEFMAATLTSEMGNTKRIVILIEECKRMGIQILPPDVNESVVEFTPDAGAIRFGLGAIKNVGKGAIISIIEGRDENGKFKTLFDLCCSIDLRSVNKKVLESLIQAGAMDSIEGHRAQLYASVETAVTYAQHYLARKSGGQTTFFEPGDADGDPDYPDLSDVAEWTENEVLQNEKDMLGFYFSGHPLSKFESEVRMFSTTDVCDLHSLKDGSLVRVGGTITQVKKHIDKKDREMAFITIEDFTGSAEILAFSDAYSKYQYLIEADKMVLCVGKLSMKDVEDEPKILLDEVIPLWDVWDKCSKNLCIMMKTDQVEDDRIRDVGNIIQKNLGDCPILINVVTPDNGEYLLRTKNMKAKPTSHLVSELQRCVGPRNVWIEA
ncbi:MAG: DNA polymerase III subunit alpha [candidate division KSB1 bacterium]|jgi:DNA polymerase-3 subunit alpha|nr:DNA polymerase III subunit alpha [candidate division KSB1 bacterium]